MAAGDLHLTNANVRDALALRRHSELKKKENIQKGGKKSGYGRIKYE